MPEPGDENERKIHIRLAESLHRRLRVRCAELDLTIQDFVVQLLARELGPGHKAKKTTTGRASSPKSKP